jgi:hypothetical protein
MVTPAMIDSTSVLGPMKGFASGGFENLRLERDDDDIGRARFGRVEFGAGGGEFGLQHGIEMRLAHRER